MITMKADEKRTMPVQKKNKMERRTQRRIANEPPRRSVLEEVGNSVTHGVGALLSIGGMILLLVASKSGVQLAAAIIYGICLIVLFTMSCLYHAFRWGSTVKRVFRRFDYSSIYLLIGGSFAPIFLLYLDQPLGWILFALQWGIIVVGVTLISVFGPAVGKKLHTTMYFVLGWSALAFLPKMYSQDKGFLVWTLLGGVAYTLGAIPFARKTRGSHFIWHLFVLLGAMLQFVGNYLYLYRI